MDFTRSSSAALTLLERTEFNCIISNLSRPGDYEQAARPETGDFAGFKFFEALRAKPEFAELPFIIYSRSLDENAKRYGNSLGIEELTDDPRILLEYVLDNAKRRPQKARA